MSVYIWAGIFSVLELIKYLLCLIIVFGIPIYKKKWVIPTWISLSLVICVLYFSIYDYHGIFFILPNLCVLMLLIAFDKKKRLKGILYIILSWIIIDSFTEIVTLILSVISGNDVYLSNSTTIDQFVEKYIVIAFLVLYHLIVNVLIRKKVSYALYPYQWVIIILCFVGMLMIVVPLELIASGESARVDTVDYIVMAICVMLMLFLFIIIMIWQSYVLRKNMKMKEREIGYQSMLKSQSEYFDRLLKNDTEMRRLRHDMRAHIAALREMATRSGDEKILEYISGMEEKTNATNTKRYTGNNAVDAVINELVSQMEENGVNFKFDGIINIREDIKDFDLCTIFYNILKNAMEASMKVEGAERNVTVKVKNIGDKVGISVSNDTVIKELPETGVLYSTYTTKEDSANHGFGTVNVKEVVSKYNGIYENELIDGRFVADIII